MPPLMLVKNIKQGAGKFDYCVIDYLGALVGDFIRGKKLQEEEGEQREQNESEEILASLVSQWTKLFCQWNNIKQRLVHRRKPQVEEEKQNSTKPACMYPTPAWRWVGNHLLHAVVKKGQASVLVADKRALLNEADEYLGLGELGVELLVGAVSAFEETCRKARGFQCILYLSLFKNYTAYCNNSVSISCVSNLFPSFYLYLKLICNSEAKWRWEPISQQQALVKSSYSWWDWWLISKNTWVNAPWNRNTDKIKHQWSNPI